MAENAANFTFTSQNRPSLFEIIAQKSLNDTLHPALQKLALLLSTNCPKKFDWLGKYYDEVFLVLSLGFQYNYFKHYDSTFSENFYGLKRILDDNSALTESHRFVSLIFSVVLPYFKRKLDERITLYRLEEVDGCLRENFEGHYKRFLIFSHSTFELTWGLLTVYNYIKYLSHQTNSQLPILRLIHLKYSYSEPEMESPGFFSNLFKCEFSSLFKFAIIKNAMTSTFTTTAFLLQFLQIWHTNKNNYSITALPSVPVPCSDAKSKNFVNKCPICLQPWKIPTVLPVSGYVFCFSCIFRYLTENQRCPVTNLSAKPLDTIRLYDNE